MGEGGDIVLDYTVQGTCQEVRSAWSNLHLACTTPMRPPTACRVPPPLTLKPPYGAREARHRRLDAEGRAAAALRWLASKSPDIDRLCAIPPSRRQGQGWDPFLEVLPRSFLMPRPWPLPPLQVEKKYLRLTQNPDPRTVRPESVLKQAIRNSLYHIRSQPLSRTVTASITCGCSLYHMRLQAIVVVQQKYESYGEERTQGMPHRARTPA